jgi:DNA-binding NtrC family response regulator
MYESDSVLFVDDEINILSSLRRGLLEEEYTCHFAESAIHAMEFLEQKKIHVLITDM